MSKERILIVEDDADIREGVRILLESEDYMVDEAEDGREGLENLRDDTDLVILDIMMPGISGLRTCEEIRKISNVPVLFLTAKVQESDKLIGLMAGMEMTILPSRSPMQNFWGESRHSFGDIKFIWAKMKPQTVRRIII